MDIKTEILLSSGSDEEYGIAKKKKTTRSAKKRKADAIPVEGKRKRKKVDSLLSEADNNEKKPSISKMPKLTAPSAKTTRKKVVKKQLEMSDDDSETVAAKKPKRSAPKVKSKTESLIKKEILVTSNIFADSFIPSSNNGLRAGSSDFISSNKVPTRQWSDEEIVSETVGVPIPFVKSVISLLNQECTVPFIARYRREMTGNLPAEKIREVQMSYENVKSVCKKADNIAKTLVKEGKDEKVISDILNAKTAEEVEYLYAPFKPGSKRSLAERARQLGLAPHAEALLTGSKNLRDICISKYIDINVPGKTNFQEIQKGIQNIIADTIAKDREVLDFIRKSPQQQFIQFFASESASAKKEQKRAFIENKETQHFKFENYFHFCMAVKNVNAHQIMAINRGENLKVLTVKLKMQSHFKEEIVRKCRSLFLFSKGFDEETSKFIDACIVDAFERLLEPHIYRQIRSELTKKAYKESVDVFCNNLKQLLLTPPVRGKTVIGIDPGFSHGCKVAAVSPNGEVLQTTVLYIHSQGKFVKHTVDDQFVDLVLTHKANLVAIGNGTACRQTEAWLSELIKRGSFHTHDLKYCIVNESGASIYSVTKEAEIDLPGMDPNIRSAVSIARRLQDPLLEYVKVEPKHLGVGMYQHDIPEAMLKTALDSVVVECVSFVGVDLNVCPEVLLRRISGLSATKVKNILQWREENGTFVNRSQLLQVKGLGPKSYEQCVGFVKVFPQTSVAKKENLLITDSKIKTKKKKKKVEDFKPNLLDTTIIHPESYEIAEKFLIELKATHMEIGQQSLVDKVTKYMQFSGADFVAGKFQTTPSMMQLIIKAFCELMEYDIRAEFDVPLFQTGVKSLADLKVDQVVTGRVTNVTNFGAFVDIGVGQDGLIHVSKMGYTKVQLGNRVTVKVISIDVAKKRIGLSLCKE